jgi:kynurenine formamidase
MEEPVPEEPSSSGHASRWIRRPVGSTWGDFGPDDQVGRLNLLTAEKVLQGVAEVRDGLSFCLSLPLDYPRGNVLSSKRFAPVVRPTVRQGKPNFNYVVAQDDPESSDVSNDDFAVLYTHFSTQWDSLAHIGQLFDADGDGVPEPVYYNGYRAGEDVVGPADGACAGGPDTGSSEALGAVSALGIETMAETCVQGRGVLIDLLAHYGERGVAIGFGELSDVLANDRVSVEPGDIVCLHTGFARYILDAENQVDRERLMTFPALNGRDPDLLKWITESGVAAIAADNFAVEVIPAHPASGIRSNAPLHEHCLFKLGVPLGELWYLTELATWLRERDRSRFLLTAPPLRLPGAVGSPLTPVATV